MSLSEKEIQEILAKLRSEYSSLSKQNPKAFDLPGFEKRYLQVLQMRGNVIRFLNEEVAFLEQLKSKHKELIAKKEAAKGNTINRLMDEANARLEKYPRMDFHPLAKPEMRYFYGAIKEFADRELLVINHLFRGTPEYGLFQDLIHSIERLGYQRGSQLPPRIVQHIKALLDANGSQSQMEKDTQDVLKMGAIALRKCTQLLNECVEKSRLSPDLMCKISDSESAKAASEYNTLSHKGAAQRIAEKCEEIIQDFRMGSLVPQT
jgi:hypothetical protein